MGARNGRLGRREALLGKALIITEKPSVARDIAGALEGFVEHEGYWESDAFLLTFAVGHLLELAERANPNHPAARGAR
jgi:DNA topoisomerase IA